MASSASITTPNADAYSETKQSLGQSCTKEQSSVEQDNTASQPPFEWKKCSLGFWMIIVANATCQFLAAFEISATATALPTIAQSLGGADFVWVGSAYTLASTAVVPLCGNLVSIVGRKPVLMASIGVFALGSALSGAAQSMNMLVAARAVQGFGCGGCMAVTMIIHADLVPLPQRGVLQGITAIVWVIATAIGPVSGGAFASAGAWRWLFYFNLPICAIAAVLELIFLHNNPPQATFNQKIRKLDLLGGVLIIGGSVTVLIALTWGGLRFPWVSAQVLVPLLIGIIALGGFFLVEKYLMIEEPIVPWPVVTNRTSLSGYISTAIHGIVGFVAFYYLPVYFQAVQGASAVRSGIDLLATGVIMAPSTMICGITTQRFRVYRPQNFVGWALIVIGFGILTVLDASSSRAKYIGCQIILGTGLGTIWIAPMFAILAPLHVSYNASALAFYMFVKTLFQTLGIALGGTILQNTLRHKLPESFLSNLPSGISFAYSAIPTIPSLPEPVRTEVRVAFADSLKLLWEIMIGISGLGLISVFMMKEVPMRMEVDEQWTLGQTEASIRRQEDEEDKPAV